MSDQHDRILILDYGSQFTQLIARRVREAHVYCEIHPHDVSDRMDPGLKPRGHHPLRRPDARSTTTAALRAAPGGLPISACRCWDLLRDAAHALSSRRRGGASPRREFGYAEVRAHGHSRLLNGIEDFSTAG